MKPVWFDFLEHLKPALDAELTSLVRVLDEKASTEVIDDPLRLDWLVHVGGSERKRLEASLERHPAPRFKIGMRPDPVLKFEIAAWLEERKHSHIQVVDDEWRKAMPQVEMEVVKPRLVSLSENESWYEKLELEFPELAPGFIQEMAQNGVDINEPPWIFWSRLPPILKRRGQDIAKLSRLDERLTFLRVSLSPQDEISERASLQTQQLMINPTFEFVETSAQSGSQSGPIVALARQFDVVIKRQLTALEASVLDHVRESFRIERVAVLKQVSQETGVRKEFVNAAVDGLIADLFLLGDSSGNGRSVLLDQ